jgi:hypothetical protein
LDSLTDASLDSIFRSTNNTNTIDYIKT